MRTLLLQLYCTAGLLQQPCSLPSLPHHHTRTLARRAHTSRQACSCQQPVLSRCAAEQHAPHSSTTLSGRLIVSLHHINSTTCACVRTTPVRHVSAGAVTQAYATYILTPQRASNVPRHETVCNTYQSSTAGCVSGVRGCASQSHSGHAAWQSSPAATTTTLCRRGIGWVWGLLSNLYVCLIILSLGFTFCCTYHVMSSSSLSLSHTLVQGGFSTLLLPGWQQWWCDAAPHSGAPTLRGSGHTSVPSRAQACLPGACLSSRVLRALCAKC